MYKLTCVTAITPDTSDFMQSIGNVKLKNVSTAQVVQKYCSGDCVDCVDPPAKPWRVYPTHPQSQCLTSSLLPHNSPPWPLPRCLMRRRKMEED